MLRYIREHDLVENARQQGERLLVGGLALMREHEIVGNVVGLGLMVGLELVSNPQNKQPFPAALKVAARVGDAALARGLITYPLQGCIDGVEGDMIKLTPPLSISAEQIDELLVILSDALGAVELELAA